jgi:hypothetical protein
MRELTVTVWCDPHYKRDAVKFEAAETISLPVGGNKLLELDLCKNCLHQKLDWQGWTDLFQAYGHKPDEMPRVAKPARKAEPKPVSDAVVPATGPFVCICGESYETQRRLNGHIGQRGRHSDGREHGNTASPASA